MSYDLVVAGETELSISAALMRLRAMTGVSSVVVHHDHQLEVSFDLPDGRATSFFVEAARYQKIERFADWALDYVRKPEWLVELTVPASGGERGVKLARKAAIIIARMTKGAAFDDQEDGVIWPLMKPFFFQRERIIFPPKRDVDIVSFDWVAALPKDPLLRSGESRRVCASFLDSLSKYLPAAVPLRGDARYRGEMMDFEESWRFWSDTEYGGNFNFETAEPFHEGFVRFLYPRDSLESPKHALACVHVSLPMDASAIADSETDSAHILAFAKIADCLNAVYGSAHLLRGFEFYRGELWARKGADRSPPLTKLGWTGIPPTAGWLLWFHRTYLAQMPGWSTENALFAAENGCAFRLGRSPCSIKEAAELMPPLPEDLIFKEGELAVTGYIHGARAANRIPAYENFQPIVQE